MPKITSGEVREFKRDRWCGICRRLIPAGATCYVRQQVLVGECHKRWLEKNVAPDSRPRRHKRYGGKPEIANHKESQDLKDMAHYPVVFGRHLAKESRNIVGIKRAMKDYEGTSRDW